MFPIARHTEGFRVNAKIRQRSARSKRRLLKRLDKNNNQGCERPMFTASNIHYELADRTRAISAGGLGLIHRGVKHLVFDEAIDRRLQLLKSPLPDHEWDPVPTTAYTVRAGGPCLEHLELLRNNKVYLDALGPRR